MEPEKRRSSSPEGVALARAASGLAAEPLYEDPFSALSRRLFGRIASLLTLACRETAHLQQEAATALGHASPSELPPLRDWLVETAAERFDALTAGLEGIEATFQRAIAELTGKAAADGTNTREAGRVALAAARSLLASARNEFDDRVQRTTAANLLFFKQDEEGGGAPAGDGAATRWDWQGASVHMGRRLSTSITRDGDRVYLSFPGATKTLPLTHEFEIPNVGKLRAYDYNGGRGNVVTEPGDAAPITKHGYYKLFEVLKSAACACERLVFVQLKHVRMTVQQPGQQEEQVVPRPGQGPAWSVDVPQGQTGTPEYPSRVPGRDVAYDSPGLENPSGLPVPDGTLIRRTGLFRMWILCCAPPPRSVIGYVEYGYVISLRKGETIPADATPLEPTLPTWHGRDESNDEYMAAQDDFDRIVSREAYPGWCE